MRFKDFFVHWVEAYIVFVHLPGTTYYDCHIRNKRTANEWEDNQKIWMGKNLIDPGYDLGGGARILWT